MSDNIENLRNIGIIAHIDAGKTTTTERMLFYSEMTHHLGDVDKGNTTTDFDEDEIEKGITINSACVTFSWKGNRVNLIDTPGHVDFTAEVERSLRVLDGAVVIFSSREGVEAQSETVWHQADRYGVPRICFINKLDREGANFERTLGEIRKRLNPNAVAIQIPVGLGPAHEQNPFRAVIDLVEEKLIEFETTDQGKTVKRGDIPEEFQDEAEIARQAMLEQLVDYSDELTELLLEESPVPGKLVREVIRAATLMNQIVPVFCGSAKENIGVQPLLDGVNHYLPSPIDRPPVTGKVPTKKASKKSSKNEIIEYHEDQRKPEQDEPCCGLVFKIVSDKYGDLYYVRIYSGVLKANSRVLNPRTDKRENVSQIWHIQADKRTQVSEAKTGDIVGVIGLKDAVTGDTICEPKDPIILESINFPETVISMAIEPNSSAERKKLADTLDLMKKQDPTFRAKTDEDTGQTLISGMGELHLDIIKNRLLRDFSLDVKVHKPRVSYRETVKSSVKTTGTCDRMIGGQQLFAKVTIQLEPLKDSEESIVVENKLSPELDEEFINITLESLKEESQGGGLLGYPLMKVKITALDIESNAEQTTDSALRIATHDAFEKGLRASGIVKLEPIMKIEVSVPDEYLGDILSDLQQRRAEILGTTNRASASVIEAKVPLEALFGYSNDMRSLSKGFATSSMQPWDYAPAANQDEEEYY